VLGLRMCGILPSLLHIFQVWCSGIETTSSFKLATDGMTTDISHHHIQHPIQWLMESSFPPEEEQPNHETYHFYPLGAKMCNACRFTSHMTSYVRHRGNFTSFILLSIKFLLVQVSNTCKMLNIILTFTSCWHLWQKSYILPSSQAQMLKSKQSFSSIHTKCFIYTTYFISKDRLIGSSCVCMHNPVATKNVGPHSESEIVKMGSLSVSLCSH
jgi:hypothetical protein